MTTSFCFCKTRIIATQIISYVDAHQEIARTQSVNIFVENGNAKMTLFQSCVLSASYL